MSKSSNESDDESTDFFEDSTLYSPLSEHEIHEYKTEDMTKISKTILCRLCAGETKNPVYIYSEFGQNVGLEEKINSCLSLKIKKTDPLPKQVCVACLEKLTFCQQFDLDCQRAEETLFEILRVKSSKLSSSCPLCLEGELHVFEDKRNQEFYDSDLILSSSDEEMIPNYIETNLEEDLETITLSCLSRKERFYKCGACSSLFRSKDELEAHKCKPHVQSQVQGFKCDICATSFGFEERLEFHKKFQHGENPLFCEICNTNFAKEIKFFFHYKRFHCRDGKVSCLQCGRLFEDKDKLKSHVCKDGKNRPHVCDVCSKGFCDGYTLKRHIVTHLPEKPFKCEECKKSFTQKSRLNKHVATHRIVLEENQIVWRCTNCGEALANIESATLHLENHPDHHSLEETISKLYHCEFCDRHFIDQTSLRDHQNTFHYVEVPYTCTRCNETFKSFTDATTHWKNDPRLFKILVVYFCVDCGKESKELSLLYKHRHKRHCPIKRRSLTGSEKYFCELCGSTFVAEQEFEEHARGICSKFPCDVCGNILPTARSLNAHKRRHSGLRPYVCNICGKSYTQSSHMWTHKRFHMGVKPYTCQYCEQRFTIKPDLADHTRKKHTRERPFKCEVCNKAFLTGSVFYQHRLIHRGDRRYKCQFCEKAFTRTEALNNHIKIHTGEKPHACDVCGRKFRQKGDMRKHRRTQHVDK